MRTKIAFCVVAAIAMNSPLMAGVGDIQFHLTSGGSSNPAFVFVGVGGIVPVEVSFSATASGTTGANRGVGGVNFSLETNLPLADQNSMVLALSLIRSRKAAGSTTPGAGFSFSTNDEGVPIDGSDDDPNLDIIDAVGAFQGLSPDFDFRNPMGVLKLGSMEENVGHSGAVLMAFGEIVVDPATPAGTYVLTVIPNSAILWSTDASEAVTLELVDTITGGAFGDTLNLVVGVPEPATMLLFAPVAWAIRRRRNNA